MSKLLIKSLTFHRSHRASHRRTLLSTLILCKPFVRLRCGSERKQAPHSTSRSRWKKYRKRFSCGFTKSIYDHNRGACARQSLCIIMMMCCAALAAIHHVYLKILENAFSFSSSLEMAMRGKNIHIALTGEAHQIDCCYFEPIDDLVWSSVWGDCCQRSVVLRFSIIELFRVSVVAAWVNLLFAARDCSYDDRSQSFTYFYLRSSLFLNHSIHLICMLGESGRSLL